MAKSKKALGFQWCQYVFDVYLGLLFTVFVIFCTPYSTIGESKFVLFLLVCGGFVVATAVSILELLVIKEVSTNDILCFFKKRKFIIVISILYLAFTVISAICSPYEYNSVIGHSRYEGLLTQTIYVFVFILSMMFGRIKKWHIYSFAFTVTAVCTLCIIQLFGYNPFKLYPEGFNYYGAFKDYAGEFIGTIGNSDLVSGFLAMSALFFLSLSTVKKNKQSPYITFVFVLNVVVLFSLRVASGILAVCVTAFFVLPFIIFREKQQFFKVIAFVQILCVIVSITGIYLYDFGGSGTLYEFHEILNGRIDYSFGSGRIKIWSSVLGEIKNHFFFGTGPDSMFFWELDGFSRYLDGFGYTIEHGIDVAHNEYLNVLAQQGVLSFISYILIIAGSLAYFVKKRYKPLKLIIILPIVGYLIYSFFSFSMCMVTPFLWTFMGIMLSDAEEVSI